jgi:hypothetical protein
MLQGGFLVPDKRYLDNAAALGTNYVHNNRTAGHPLGHSANHGVDIIEAVIEKVETFPQVSNILFLLFQFRFGIILLAQICPRVQAGFHSG